MTERLGLAGRVNYGRYETQVITNEYTNVGVQVGVDYQLSETTSLSVLAGRRETKQTLDGLDGRSLSRDSAGTTYSLRFSKQFEAGGGLDLEARRELAPSGSAQVLDTSGLYANLNVPVRPRWRFTLNGVAYRNRNLYGEQGLSDRTYVSVAPSIAYELDESWRLSLGYLLRWQERDEVPGNAVSNAIFLNLNWAGPWEL